MRHRTHLEYLLYSAMFKVLPDVVSDCRRQWQEQGQTEEPDRTALVNCLLQQFGPEQFLQLCEKFPLHAPASPLFFLLYNSSTPVSLVNKISSHAPLFHQSRRLEVIEEGENYFTVEDVYFAGPPSIPADDMFVCSILKGVLSEYGCRDLTVEWESVRSRELYNILSSVNIKPLSIEMFTRWRYRWTRLERSYRIEGMDDFFLENIDGNGGGCTDSLLYNLQHLLAEDLSCRPPIKITASKLNISSRSLQRKLHAEGTSYAKVYNDMRIKAAERLLLASSMTLSEISHYAGFNDSAHLCREFNKKHHLTPGKFRRGR